MSLYFTRSTEKIIKLLNSNQELKDSFEQLFEQKKDEQFEIFHQIIKKLTNVLTWQWIKDFMETELHVKKKRTHRVEVLPNNKKSKQSKPTQKQLAVALGPSGKKALEEVKSMS